MTTKTYTNPFTNSSLKELKFTFDEEALDPVNQTFANGGIWGVQLVNASSMFLRPDSHAIDVGSNIGGPAVLMASITSGKIFAIEADPANHEILVKNKENNNLDNLLCYNVAASDKEGSVNFSQAGPGGHVQTEGWGKESIPVPAVTVDSIVGNTPIDFIKMDVEGWEMNALDGMKRTIAQHAPVFVFEINGFCLKWFNYTPNDLIRKFEDFGYRIFVIANQLVPINSYEPFPFGVVDCFAVMDHHIPVIARHMGLPLSQTQRKNIFKEAQYHGNNDMRQYFNWYSEQYKF